MKKFNKMYYYTSKKEKKLNCYYINVPKQMVEEAKLEDAEVEVILENGKIIIQKA